MLTMAERYILFSSESENEGSSVEYIEPAVSYVAPALAVRLLRPAVSYAAPAHGVLGPAESHVSPAPVDLYGPAVSHVAPALVDGFSGRDELRVSTEVPTVRFCLHDEWLHAERVL